MSPREGVAFFDRAEIADATALAPGPCREWAEPQTTMIPTSCASASDAPASRCEMLPLINSRGESVRSRRDEMLGVMGQAGRVPHETGPPTPVLEVQGVALPDGPVFEFLPQTFKAMDALSAGGAAHVGFARHIQSYRQCVTTR